MNIPISSTSSGSSESRAARRPVMVTRIANAKPGSRLLSIDFDGVAHPTGAGTTTIKTTLFGWLPDLHRVLAPHPDVRVLVHSSWRCTYSSDELQMMLGPLEKRFVGAAPRGPRYESVLQWLHDHPAYTSFRMLDDDRTEFPDPLPAELILCDPEQGVSDPRVQAQLRAWLDDNKRS